MGRNSNSHYFYELRRAKLEYVFRAYVLHHGESWPDKYTLLCRLANACGDHRTWGEIVHPDGERQEWSVWAFKGHGAKLQFEAGVPAIMGFVFSQAADAPLPIGRYAATYKAQ